MYVSYIVVKNDDDDDTDDDDDDDAQANFWIFLIWFKLIMSSKTKVIHWTFLW